MHIPVKEKMQNSSDKKAPPVWALKIRELRRGSRLRQKDLAAAMGVNQSSIAVWEKGKFRPSALAFAALAKLADDTLRDYFLREAGPEFQKQHAQDEAPQDDGDAMRVPLLKDSVAAGSPRNIKEGDIKGFLSIPRSWLPRSKGIVALEVTGDSMSPLIDNGYHVLVDTTQRDPKTLLEHMVAAREGDGVTIKWLRKDGKYWMLVPQHTSVNHPVRVLDPNDDWGIVGRVICWIGTPRKRGHGGKK